MGQYRLVKSQEDDKRSLKEILDDINDYAVQADYLTCRGIQEDLAEIWRRYQNGTLCEKG